MSDKLFEAPSGVLRRFQDMGDGTHAEVVAVSTSGGGVTRAAQLFRRSDSSAISGGTKSVTFANTGAANATVTAGATVLKPGEVVNFVAPGNDTLSSIAYVATGTELLIAVVV